MAGGSWGDERQPRLRAGAHAQLGVVHVTRSDSLRVHVHHSEHCVARAIIYAGRASRRMEVEGARACATLEVSSERHRQAVTWVSPEIVCVCAGGVGGRVCQSVIQSVSLSASLFSFN